MAQGNAAAWRTTHFTFAAKFCPLGMASRNVATTAYEVVTTAGSVCGSIVAMCGVMYVPIRTFMDVEALLKGQAGLQAGQAELQADVATIKDMLMRNEPKQR